MTDLELLELAAKAAAIDPGYGAVRQGDFGLEFYGGGNRMTWNPLTDDGDALRLAAHMGITASLASVTADREIYAQAPHVAPIFQPVSNDIYAATRRAIVRAAAALADAGGRDE